MKRTEQPERHRDVRKVFLVGDTSDRLNWGCRATSRMLHSMTNQVATITHIVDLLRPGAAISAEVVSRDRGHGSKARDLSTRAHPLVFRAGRRLLLARPSLSEKHQGLLSCASFSDYPALAHAIKRGRLFPHIGRAIHECDVVIINGEGAFMMNRPQGHLRLLVAYTAITQYGKPCAIVNHTADFRNPRLHAIASEVYPLLNDALFRDPYSVDHAGPLRKGRSADFAADVVFRYTPLDASLLRSVAARNDYFSIYPENASGFDPSRPYICVGGSAAYFAHHDEPFEPIEAYTRLCTRLRRLAPVVLTASSKPDDIFLRPVAQQLGLPFFGLRTPPQQAVDILGNAALYVGGRWHPSIMALTGGTPIVAFSSNSDYKSRGIVQLAGLKQDAISAFDISKREDDIISLADEYLREGEPLRHKLLGRARELAKSAEDNIRILRPSSGLLDPAARRN